MHQWCSIDAEQGRRSSVPELGRVVEQGRVVGEQRLDEIEAERGGDLDITWQPLRSIAASDQAEILDECHGIRDTTLARFSCCQSRRSICLGIVGLSSGRCVA